MVKASLFPVVPPKTTGREMFGHTYAMECLADCREHKLSDNDCIATLTELTIQTIAGYIQRFITEQNPIDILYVSGGGVHNQMIMRRLGELLSDTAVGTCGQLRISRRMRRRQLRLRFWQTRHSKETQEIYLPQQGHLFGKHSG